MAGRRRTLQVVIEALGRLDGAELCGLAGLLNSISPTFKRLAQQRLDLPSVGD